MSEGDVDDFDLLDDFEEQPAPQFDENDVDFPFKTLSHHVREFWWPKTIARIEKPTNMVQFYREYVAQSKPCIIKNAFNGWKALDFWDLDYLEKVAGDLEISADLTPSGHGDCVTISPDYDPSKVYPTPDSVPDGEVYDPSLCFVKPMQERIRFSQFCNALRKHHKKTLEGDPTAESDEVYYLQHQNDSFRKEFAAVLDQDMDKTVEQFGTELFGFPPDAINFWAGDSRAVSSMHKDHYENLYCVVKGTKKFTLLPPTDLPWLHQRWYREANFARDEDGKLIPVMQDPENAIPWIPVDPDLSKETLATSHPRAENISPLYVEVHEGEMLYLPALVYHKVAQQGDEKEGKIVAINYWFDMQFGTSYSYFKQIEALVSQRDTRERTLQKMNAEKSDKQS